MDSNVKKIMLNKAGGLFANLHGINYSEDIKFSVNAEACYQYYFKRLLIKFLFNFIIACILIHYVYGNTHSFSILVISILIAASMENYLESNILFSKINVIKMAKSWKPHRKNLLKIAKKTEKTFAFSEKDDDLATRGNLEQVIFCVSQQVALLIVREKSLLGMVNHPKLEKRKELLNNLARPFNIIIPWEDILKETKTLHGNMSTL